MDENERQVDRWRQGGLMWLFVIVGFDFKRFEF